MSKWENKNSMEFSSIPNRVPSQNISNPADKTKITNKNLRIDKPPKSQDNKKNYTPLNFRKKWRDSNMSWADVIAAKANCKILPQKLITHEMTQPQGKWMKKIPLKIKFKKMKVIIIEWDQVQKTPQLECISLFSWSLLEFFAWE